MLHIHPSNNEEITTLVDASPQDVDIAVSAARKAFDESGWPEMGARERKRDFAKVRRYYLRPRRRAGLFADAGQWHTY